MKLKKVLITGASRGIGRAIAATLAANKSYQIIGTARDVNSIKNKIGNVQYINLDLSNEMSVKQCLEQTIDVDILINNAGVAQIGPVEELPIDKLKFIFDVNFFGMAMLTQSIGQQMRKRGQGQIISISSLADKIPIPYLSGYCASKAALTSFMLCLRMELKKHGVKVSVISPADINTDMKAELIFDKESVHADNVTNVDKTFAKSMAASPGPELIAKYVNKILTSKNPKPVYNVGNMIGSIMFLKRSLPDRAIEKVVQSMYGV